MLEIKDPRRILAVGAPDSGVLQLLKDLTGSAPDPIPLPPSEEEAATTTNGHSSTDSRGAPTATNGNTASESTRAESSITTAPEPHSPRTTTAGLTHPLPLTTPYYTATPTIWLDEIPHLGTWVDEFLSPAAEPVVRAIGAWVYVFRHPSSQSELEHIKKAMRELARVVETHLGYQETEVGKVAVVMGAAGGGQGVQVEWEEWEDVGRENGGWEVVDGRLGFTGGTRNEFGELQGVERVREVLEGVEWQGAEDETAEEDGLEGATESRRREWLESYDAEEAEMSAEFGGLRMELAGADIREGDQEAQVEEMERMMSQLLAVRERVDGLPETERRRIAAREVERLMGDLGI